MNIRHSGDNRIEARGFGLQIRIEAWLADAIRVRVTPNPEFPSDSDILMPPQPGNVAIAVRGAEKNDVALKTGITDFDQAVANVDARMTCGNLTVTLSGSTLSFYRNSDGKQLLQGESLVECAADAQAVTGAFSSLGNGIYRIETHFDSHPDEKIFGMGQHRHGFLDQKGCDFDLFHHNCEINIPFALSSRGYGFVWNNPAVGRAVFGRNRTSWISDQSASLDYVVVAGDTPADILCRYADLTGHAPAIPEWATGFWQCKLRYRTQDELLDVAREYKRRNLPISVIVIDFMNWSHSGDYQFDEEAWPDPAGMVKELREMGIEVVVSNWPTVSQNSRHYSEMHQAGMLVRAEHGLARFLSFRDAHSHHGWEPLALIDPTNPETRHYVWEKVREGYCRHGIRAFWLDAIEPELLTRNPDFAHMRYHAGPAMQSCALYPWYSQKLYFDGLKADGENEILTLGRSAFLGSQRFGAAVWNGDIPSTFEALEASIRSGLNMAVSGIPWWTTDIGGFYGGNIESEEFRELIVRWFQYGVFCPLFRLHGTRSAEGKDWEEVPNEVWSFGDKAYDLIVECLHLRERLRPYIMEQMNLASETGLPPMRPLFVDFPADEEAWRIEDQFMLGPDILVAPVYSRGAQTRSVYLPVRDCGLPWRDAWTGAEYAGGQTLDVAAPLDRIPLFVTRDLPIPPG